MQDTRLRDLCSSLSWTLCGRVRIPAERPGKPFVKSTVPVSLAAQDIGDTRLVSHLLRTVVTVECSQLEHTAVDGRAGEMCYPLVPSLSIMISISWITVFGFAMLSCRYWLFPFGIRKYITYFYFYRNPQLTAIKLFKRHWTFKLLNFLKDCVTLEVVLYFMLWYYLEEKTIWYNSNMMCVRLIRDGLCCLDFTINLAKSRVMWERYYITT